MLARYKKRETNYLNFRHGERGWEKKKIMTLAMFDN